MPKNSATNLAVITVTILLNNLFCNAAPNPQWLTFENGKIGVNFGGYHAEAGLGGLLTGNSAHGGLSASAGTPFGQRAGAGIGGSLNERTAGGAYAGASAGYGVGASAAIGGGLGEEGGAGGVGSEAHAGGVQKKVVRLGQTNTHDVITNEVVNEKEATLQEQVPVLKTKTKSKVKTFVKTEDDTPVSDDDNIQHTRTYIKKKIVSRPHKVRIETRTRPIHSESQQNFDISKFFDFAYFTNAAAGFSNPQPIHSSHSEPQHGKTVTVIENEALTPIRKIKKVTKTVVHDGEAQTSVSSSVSSKHNPGFWNDIFNIPISVLSSVNQFLNNRSSDGSGGGRVEIHKKVEIH